MNQRNTVRTKVYKNSCPTNKCTAI